ncbi:MAG: HD domain-containing protein [Lachnospiraceae bacterium]|nr:HD domain-containing protein [Lachnospiraceae bacterium]
MKYIKDIREGDSVSSIYLCRKKEIGKKKNGEDYFALVLTDKTGSLDGKIWNINNPGVAEFEAGDYVRIEAVTNLFNQRIQLIVNRLTKCSEGEYDPEDYLPSTSKNVNSMYKELMEIIKSVKNSKLRTLLENVFVNDKAVAKAFSEHSAAKTVHHAFRGGLLEHTLSVTRNCIAFAENYPILNRDVLLTAAMLHDIGKLNELSALPENDYTDEGQLLGHIYMGAEFVGKKIDQIPDFPQKLRNEIIHCILAHHGKLEFGSPKKPALAEAFALSMADDLDAKMETMSELFDTAVSDEGWLGFQKNFDSNIRKTGRYEQE